MYRSQHSLLRILLWLGVVFTAKANRRYFGLPTTWVFHLTLNSFFLFLPEMVQTAASALGIDRKPRKESLLSTAHAVLDEAVVENPNYALYVAPVALAYFVSHPQFNIYKGGWAKLRLFGFGLDAIPHSLTAFGFVNLVMDGLASLRRHTPHNSTLRPVARALDGQSALVAGALLVGASALYELGEYEIHNEELRETGGDVTKINLVWSAKDTTFDIFSNTIGWLAAVLLRKRGQAQIRRARRAAKS